MIVNGEFIVFLSIDMVLNVSVHSLLGRDLHQEPGLFDNASHYGGGAMYICLCNAITESDIRACAGTGAGSLRDLERCLGVGATCGKCRTTAKEILNDSRAASTGASLWGTPA